MKYYVRKVQSLAMWREGMEHKEIPSNQHAMRYAIDIKEGRGCPSFWLAENQEDLEKIAFGMLLNKQTGKPEPIRLLAFEQSCFDSSNFKLINKIDVSCPISSIQHLHYELNPANHETICAIVEKFLKGNGSFKEFGKNRSVEGLPSIIEVAKKYIHEVVEAYKQIALMIINSKQD